MWMWLDRRSIWSSCWIRETAFDSLVDFYDRETLVVEKIEARRQALLRVPQNRDSCVWECILGLLAENLEICKRSSWHARWIGRWNERCTGSKTWGQEYLWFYIHNTLRGLECNDWRMVIAEKTGLSWDRYDEAEEIRSIQRAKKGADGMREIQNRAVGNTEC